MELTQALCQPSPVGFDDLGGEWDQSVERALRTVPLNGSHPQLSVEESWALLGWVEGTASLAARRKDCELLQLAVLALSILLSGQQIDVREVLLVGSVVRFAARQVPCDYNAIASRVLPSESSEILRGVSEDLPATHQVVIAGGPLFSRVAQTTTEEALMRELGLWD